MAVISNPFVSGNPVDSAGFFDRTEVVYRIRDRLRNRGQSTAIFGEPRSGKTSVLRYLSAPENAERLYGSGAERLVYSIVDMQTFGGDISITDFWRRAL